MANLPLKLALANSMGLQQELNARLRINPASFQKSCGVYLVAQCEETRIYCCTILILHSLYPILFKKKKIKNHAQDYTPQTVHALCR